MARESGGPDWPLVAGVAIWAAALIAAFCYLLV